MIQKGNMLLQTLFLLAVSLAKVITPSNAPPPPPPSPGSETRGNFIARGRLLALCQ